MSTQQLSDNVDELFDLVRKSEGIISTFEARDLESEAETVEDAYQRYADTHISLGDTSGFEEKVYETVVENEKPTKGYLYGPFGYGKTSTSVSIWNTLSQNDIIAVPPFTFTSFASVMRATYGWMRYELKNKAAPEYVERLEDIHQDYLQQELEAYAESKEDQYDLDFDKLVQMLEGMERDGDLDLSINADTLIDFFSECTQLALDADFDGLVVIGDEFQQYFKSADNRQEAESRFRDLVFALQAGAQVEDEFGLFISMPEQTKSTLDTQAGDVLNRLERDNLVLNLQTVYGQDFPAELWSRYADRFGFADQAHKVISEHALNATGQICARDDLSNGPRTVIDIFRIGLKQYLDSGKTFTALDLADAFYGGEVRYQGSATKIQSAIGDALDNSAVDTQDKSKFIKLCAVFPEEGILDEVVDQYELNDARTALSKKIHGEVIKVIADGYTLVDVTRRDGPGDIVQELIRDFWRQYDTDHVNAEYAVKALANRLLCGEVFETRTGEVRGWSHGGELNKIKKTLYKDQLNGTFNGKFPRRRLNVGVTDAENKDDIVGEHDSLGGGFGSPDLAFNFVLGWTQAGEGEVKPRIEKGSDREFTFVMNGREGFEELPKGLDFLRDAMDPNAVTPFLMLALVQYLDETDAELDAQQEDRVGSFQRSLLNQALKSLFNKDLIGNAPFELRRAGKRTVEGVFTEAMQELYPDYHTLIATNQYERLLRDYMDFLDTLDTTSKRRGTDTIQESKGDVAARFNLKQTANFSDRITKHYADLLKIENADAGNYEVRAQLHPFEREIVQMLESGERERLPMDEVQQLGYEKGYRQEELEVIYGFLGRRGIVGMDETEEALVLIETDVAPADVENSIDECKVLIEKIETLDADHIPEGVPELVTEAEQELEKLTADDGERLEALNVGLNQAKSRLNQQSEVLHSRFDSRCKDLKSQAEREKRNLIPNKLENPVEGGVQFVGSLDDARSDIVADFRDLKAKLTDLETEIKEARREHSSLTIENARHLHNKVEEAEATIDDIEVQKSDLEDTADQLKRWRTFTDRVANVKRQITDYSRTFDESIEEEEDIQEFIGRISERLADDPRSALSQLGAFEEELDHIEESYQQRQKERRDVFQEKRKSLKTILDEATDGSATGLRSATYDIQQPDESQRQLLSEFKDEFTSQVVERAEDMLESAHREVEYARIVGVDTSANRDPDRVAEEIEQAQAQLRSLRSSLSHFDFSDIGTDDTDLAEIGNDVLSKAESLREDAQEFRRETEPEEDKVAELLDRIEDNRGVDFKELLMEYHEDGEEVDPKELLNRMQRLFQLNQIDIKIARRRRR